MANEPNCTNPDAQTEQARNETEDKDWDFNHVPSSHPESISIFRLIPDELGVTYINDLTPKDARRVQKMARDAFAPIAKKSKIDAFQKENQRNAETIDESAVFEIPLETLLERDRKIDRDCDSPLILQMLLLYLKYNGGSKQEGILERNDVLQRTHKFVNKLNSEFYAESFIATDSTLNKATGMEIIGVLKHFISRLPDPLLTNKFIQVFSHLDCIDDPMDKMKALKLLNLQLPQAHRASLMNLLNLFSEVISADRSTHKSLDNVAEAMAPFLFPLKEQDEFKATVHCYLTKTMILNRNIMNTVPPFMMKQIRKNGDQTSRIDESKKADAAGEASMLIDWPDRKIRDFEVKFTNQTTAHEVILRTHEECIQPESFPPSKAQDISPPANGPKFLSKLIATSYNEQCLMDPSEYPAFAIHLHSLFETGGNIEYRRLRPDVRVMNVYLKNPKVVRWVIKCQHLV